MMDSVEGSRTFSKGRYQIQQQLGNNGGRQTLLAYDYETQAQVVIKLLTFDQEFEWNSLKLFEREAETLRLLSHPQIPRFIDFFEIDSSYEKCVALVQSYIPGRSIAEHLQSGRIFTEAEIKQLMIALLEILVYLHGRYPPVVHRDIKPSNIILGDRSGNRIGQVFLVDFGSVQTLVNADDHTLTIVGTYGHMPLEQLSGRAVPASDLYGVGVTAITLATQKLPTELPQKNLQIQFEPHAQLSPALTNWLKCMTAPAVGDRFASAQAALDALNNLQHWDYTKLTQEKNRSTAFKLSKVALIKNSIMALLIYSSVVAFFMLMMLFLMTLAIVDFSNLMALVLISSGILWLPNSIMALINYRFSIILSMSALADSSTLVLIGASAFGLFGLIVSSLAYLSAYFVKRPHLYQTFIIAISLATSGAGVFLLLLANSPSAGHYYDYYGNCRDVHNCPSYNIYEDSFALQHWLVERVVGSVIVATLSGFAGWLSGQWYKRCVKED